MKFWQEFSKAGTMLFLKLISYDALLQLKTFDESQSIYPELPTLKKKMYTGKIEEITNHKATKIDDTARGYSNTLKRISMKSYVFDRKSFKAKKMNDFPSHVLFKVPPPIHY